MKSTRLSSEARRWLLALYGLLVASIGLTVLWGMGWGLLLFGLGFVLVILLYDPDRARSQP